MTSPPVSGWERLDRLPLRTLLIAVLGLQLALSMITALITLRNFPNSADEYAYLLSARLFSEGRLSSPSPEPRLHFSFTHVINDGRYYGKYPPGWPALLAVGARAGIPWIVNPLLSLVGVALLALITRELGADREARCCLLVAAGNPFLVFNAASYFSHTSCMAAIAAALLAMLRALRTPESRVVWLTIGAAAAAAFLIRPYTALACLAPAGILLFLRLRSQGPSPAVLRGLLWCCIPVAVGVGLFFLYNHLQTGNAFLQPFTQYDPGDVPRLSTSLSGWIGRLRTIGIPTLVEFNSWVPLSGFGILLALMSPDLRNHTGLRILLLSAAGLFAAYVFYPTLGGNRYGPRYAFEGTVGCIPVLAIVLRRQETAGRLALGAIVLLNAAGFVHATCIHAQQVRARMTVYDLVREAKVDKAIVFLRTGSGSMPVGDLTRNGTTFDGPVLYVHDRGPDNADFLRLHPNRESFVFEYDLQSSRGSLTPYVPPPKEKPR